MAAKRGDELRQNILWAAKGLFMEEGLARTSMDAVAVRAQTSKRTLYAHFESKEKLFLEILALSRTLFLGKLQHPAAYGTQPIEALTGFCARYAELMQYEPVVQMCRITLPETQRIPEAVAQLYDLLFGQAQQRLAAYLQSTFGLTGAASKLAAQSLLGQVLFPALPQALCGLMPLAKSVHDEQVAPSFDIAGVHTLVARWVETVHVFKR